MDYETALGLSHEAQALDPREAVCGYYGGGSFVLDSVGAFLWFKTKRAMLESIGEAEPAIYEVAEEDRILYHDRVIKLLDGESLDHDGRLRFYPGLLEGIRAGIEKLGLLK